MSEGWERGRGVLVEAAGISSSVSQSVEVWRVTKSVVKDESWEGEWGEESETSVRARKAVRQEWKSWRRVRRESSWSEGGIPEGKRGNGEGGWREGECRLVGSE